MRVLEKVGETALILSQMLTDGSVVYNLQIRDEEHNVVELAADSYEAANKVFNLLEKNF